jgi:DNA adenine methylase
VSAPSEHAHGYKWQALYDFFTVWMPPRTLILAAGQQFADLTFSLMYDFPPAGIAGQFRVERGKEVEQFLLKGVIMPATLRPPVKWHGGKHYLAKRIVGLFPDHHTYVEPFGGAASVLLNKEPSPVEVYNDLNGRITRLFRVIRDHGDELRKQLTLTPYSEAEFNDLDVLEGMDEIEAARRDFARWRMSMGGRGDTFSYTLHRVRRGMADVVSGYLSGIDQELPQIVERLRWVQILCRPAIGVIKKWDGSNTLFYCDPPYLPQTRAEGSRNLFGVEMGEDDHRELARVLRACKGRVVLSGYPSALYEELFDGWRMVEFDLANHAAGGKVKGREREILWLNW